jgi:hypothetical protein
MPQLEVRTHGGTVEPLIIELTKDRYTIGPSEDYDVECRIRCVDVEALPITLQRGIDGGYNVISGQLSILEANEIMASNDPGMPTQTQIDDMTPPYALMNGAFVADIHTGHVIYHDLKRIRPPKPEMIFIPLKPWQKAIEPLVVALIRIYIKLGLSRNTIWSLPDKR